MAATKWFDLASHGYFLGVERLRDGVSRILLLDMEDKAEEKKLLSAGFARMGANAHSRGLYYFEREGQRIKGAELAAALGLPSCPVVQKESAQIAQEFRSAYKEKVGKNLWTALQQSRKLGMNKDGVEVFDSPTGRLIQRTGEGGQIEIISERSREGRAQGGGAFLRADDAQGLADCADGFFNEIRSGARMNWSDLERSARTAFERDLVNGEVTDMQLRLFQEAVEAAGYRAFHARESTAINKHALDLAESYYNGLPVARMRTAESITLQQYSTPLPMGVIAQRLLVGDDNIENKTILEPTAGNGGLFTLVGKQARVFAIELDSKRANVLKNGNCEAVIVGDALDLNYKKSFQQEEGFDYTITNPPFGGMESDRSFDKLPRVKRADYYIALKTLEARKPEGRSVLILGGDEQRRPGEIRGGTPHFLNYVYDHYNVLGAVEMDGRMYSKQGAGANVRMLVVGERRESPIKADIPERFNVLRTYGECWDWAESIVQTYAVDKTANQSVEASTAPEAEAEKIDAPRSEVPSGANQAKEAHAAASKPVVERTTNEYQTPYQAASQVAPPTGMVPINLAGATYAALADLQEKVGPIDGYVAKKLQYKVEELGNFFSPEQVDALGLAISKMDEGRAFTNSDFTGFGKGRFCAAMLRYAKLEGKVPVFLTIKKELFTDIFRDLKDIDSDHLFKQPFIFNEGARIMRFGSASDVLHPATSPGARKAALEVGVLPEGTDLVLSTYSQFQRKPEINRKSALLAEIASQGTVFVADEAHVAAGESNVSYAVGEALSKTDAVVYASATPFKGVANFRVYGRMFPESVDLEGLPDTLKSGGEALMEAISSNMAKDGVFIRRELDLSRLEFASREPSADRMRFNREASDQVARILSRMAYLSGDVNKEVNQLNKEFKERAEIASDDREGKRMQASSMNFGSRLYNINRQLLLSLVVDEAASAAIEALEQGRKPVIAVENTGESLLREVLARRAGVVDLLDELENLKSNPADDPEAAQARMEEIKQKVDEQLGAVKLDRPPQFRDLLEVMLDRIGTIKVQERYGEYVKRKPASEGYEEEESALRAMIRELPDMPLSALDVINQRLKDHGYEPTEVSGRTVSLEQEIKGGDWVPKEHKKVDAVASVAGYQNGTFDCITITRAGSTGISLHATNRFKDSDIRQREFIVAQKAANIAEFLQWMGRVNRRDQVSHPVMRTIETGLPAESRLTMMHNAKLRKLSANTTSNRDNANIEGEDLDLLNDLGDRIALDWLTENPRIAKDLDIELPTDEKETLNSRSQDCPYINKLMGRLTMIPVEKQEEILSILSQRFKDKVEELEQRGINPFKVDVYDWKAKAVSEDELVSPTLSLTSSTFDDPVKIIKLHYEEEVQPIREDKLLEMIKKGHRQYKDAFEGDGGNFTENIEKFQRAVSEAANKFVIKQLPEELQQAVNEGTLHLNTALEDKKAGSAKKAQERMNYLMRGWRQMVPGIQVEYEDQIKGNLAGYVTQVSLPKNKDQLTSLGEYRMQVVFPGESKTKTISLATLYSQDKLVSPNVHVKIHPDRQNNGIHLYAEKTFREIMDSYNDVPDGLVTRSATVLSGNIFRSVEMASNNKLGSPILYTDEHGNRQRAVLVKSHITPEKIKSMPIGMRAHEVTQYINALNVKFDARENKEYYERFAPVYIGNTPVLDGTDKGGIIIQRLSENRYELGIPGTKTRSGGLMADGRIFDIGAKTPEDSLNLSLAGTRKSMRCVVDAQALPQLLERLGSGHVGRFYVQDVDLEIIKELQEQNRADKRHGHAMSM